MRLKIYKSYLFIFKQLSLGSGEVQAGNKVKSDDRNGIEQNGLESSSPDIGKKKSIWSIVNPTSAERRKYNVMFQF